MELETYELHPADTFRRESGYNGSWMKINEEKVFFRAEGHTLFLPSAYDEANKPALLKINKNNSVAVWTEPVCARVIPDDCKALAIQEPIIGYPISYEASTGYMLRAITSTADQVWTSAFTWLAVASSWCEPFYHELAACAVAQGWPLAGYPPAINALTPLQQDTEERALTAVYTALTVGFKNTGDWFDTWAKKRINAAFASIGITLSGSYTMIPQSAMNYGSNFFRSHPAVLRTIIRFATAAKAHTSPMLHTISSSVILVASYSGMTMITAAREFISAGGSAAFLLTEVYTETIKFNDIWKKMNDEHKADFPYSRVLRLNMIDQLETKQLPNLYWCAREWKIASYKTFQNTAEPTPTIPKRTLSAFLNEPLKLATIMAMSEEHKRYLINMGCSEEQQQATLARVNNRLAF